METPEMLFDPLVIRYRNDPYFHRLVDHIRQAACEVQLTEDFWRDAVTLAFEIERMRGLAHRATPTDADAQETFNMLGVQVRGFVEGELTPELEAMRGIVASCLERWPSPIPVSERLPAVGASVQWFSQGSWEYGERVDSTLNGKNWWKPDSHYDICPIEDTATHWLPMPPAPTDVSPPAKPQG